MFIRCSAAWLSRRKGRLASFAPSLLLSGGLITWLVFSASACAEARTRRSEAATVTVVDGIGREVRVPLHPGRIISLAPSVTEILYMLRADDRLIGVSTHCDWPDDARRKPKVGTLLSPNYETILAARPDLIIASTAGNDQAATLKLADFNLTLYVTAPRSVSAIHDTVVNLGRITDCRERGEQLAAQMQDRLAAVQRRISGMPPTRAFFITWFDPLLAPGGRTFENDVLRLANVNSISAAIDEFYPRYSLEQVLMDDPDAILTVRHAGDPLPDLTRIAGWSRLRAVREGRVYVLSEVLQHPSPRFVEGVEELASKLYPERFR
jgi:iron complex transport system substrate-binding protein